MEETRTRRYAEWPSLALAIVFAFFYAFVLWQAVGNLIGMANLLGSVLSPLGWTFLVLGVLAPVVCFVGALLTGRHRGYAARTLIFAVGLTAAATTYLSIVSFVV